MISLLGENCVVNDQKWFQDMLKDLNIHQIFLGLKSVSAGYDVEDMYRMFPRDEQTMEFRRTITFDMAGEAVRNYFECFSKKMKLVRKLEKNARSRNVSGQQLKFHCDALEIYFEAIGQLSNDLIKEQNLSSALQSLSGELQEYLTDKTIVQIREKVEAVRSFFADRVYRLSVGNGSLEIAKIERASVRCHPDEGEYVLRTVKTESAGGDGELWSIEETLIRHFQQNEKPVWRTMKELRKVDIEERFLELEVEVQFYLSFFKYISQFQQMGYEFCLPQSGNEIEIEKGYDFALAGKEISGGKKVIANSFYVTGKEKMVVVTGANGGGKTTYARMVGEVLYFSSMGLLVPARAAKLPFFDKIATHFPVEESEKTGRGKLLEELYRLKPILKDSAERQFIILNELFTTAATKDALEMGKNVIYSILDKNMRGIYVTHIRGLSEETSGIVSMTAELCEDHKTRSFVISRRLPDEEEYEDSLIEKYHLLENQIEEDLSYALSK